MDPSNPYHIKLEEIIADLSADTMVKLGLERPVHEDAAFSPATEKAFGDHRLFLPTAAEQLMDHVYRRTREYLESQVGPPN